jgi:hypothetical protein
MHRKTRISLLCGIILVALMTGGCLQDFEESRLRVNDIDISAERITSTNVLLNVTTYVENNGNGESGEVKLILKAFDSMSGLLVDETATSAGHINKDKTIPVAQLINVERDGGYRIDIVLFEDDERLRQRSVKISGIGDLIPNINDIGIRIQEMDFLVENVTDSRVTISVDIYLTNEGGCTSEDLPMLVKAREVDAGLLADKVWITTGKIEKEKTIINSCDIAVPDGYNYIVEALIWRNDTIVERGEGVVQLNPKRTIPADEEIISDEIHAEDFMPTPAPTPAEMEYGRVSGATEKKMPGFTSAMTGVTVMIVIFMLIRIRRDDNND